MATAYLFVKGTADDDVERLVAHGQLAAARDTLDKLAQTAAVTQIVVATADAAFAEDAAALGAHVEPDSSADFHFGERLASLVDRYPDPVALYVGGGSGALMSAADWRDLVEQAERHPNTVFTNNFFSCDLAAWSPGDALKRIVPPALDNDLAFRLKEQAGLDVVALPKNAGTQLDIDTPTDLMTLSLHPAVPTHLRAYLTGAGLDLRRARDVRALVHDRRANLIVAGRVSASMALYLERTSAAQWRIFSEERGMRASGREERGEVRSFLGFHLDRVGPAAFFAELHRLADAVVMDSRVLFAHAGRRPSAADRFRSDLIAPGEIADPFVRSFTAAAAAAGYPILLGGHSLVSGGLYALAEK